MCGERVRMAHQGGPIMQGSVVQAQPTKTDTSDVVVQGVANFVVEWITPELPVLGLFAYSLVQSQ